REGGRGKKTLVSFRSEKLVGVWNSGPDRPEFVRKSPSRAKSARPLEWMRLGEGMPNGNPLKRKLQAGQVCFGAWMLSTSADMAEILAYGGMDFLLLDHEHGQGSIDDAIGQLRAIKGSDCVGVLRVP